MGNLLSDNAVREIKQIGLKVKELEKKFLAGGARPNQRRYQTFAEIDSNIADETYTADQVIGDTDGILGATPSDPIRWDNDSTGVGYLYAVDDTSGDATGIFPVFPYSDGTDTYWAFKTHQSEFEHVFKVTANDDGTSIDIGKRRGDADYQFTDTITIYSGRDGDMEEVEKTSTENVAIVAGTNHIYYEIKNGTSEVWEAEAKKSSVWPPSDIEDDQQKLGWLVAEVELDGTDITIGQEVFHNPNLWTKQFLPSFSPVQTDGFVKITEGRVNLASGSTTISEASFSTSSVLYMYVEVTSNNGDTTPTVTSTLQTSGTEPTYSEENSSGDLTRRYVIGKCTGTGNAYQPYHVGDLNLGTLYQPDFDIDMRGDDPTVGQFIAYEDATSIGADKDVFLKARKVTLDWEGGELADNTDDGTAYFGGDTTNLVQDYVSTIDTDSTEIVFKRAELSIDVDSGLTQSLTVGAEANEAVISADEEWIHIEPGAKIKHVNAEVTDEADLNHWGTLSYDGTTATWDPRVGATITGTSFAEYVDIRKHLYKVTVDGTSSTDPEDQTNYKYRNCDDPTSFIVCPTETNQVFRDMGVCWELVGETTDDDDDTVTDQTFADCTTCIGDGTDVNIWLKCSDDSTAALIDTPSSPDDDYAWLCLSSVWVKCYNWAVGEGTADNPDYLEQCGTTPTDCTDLVGWPGSDDFGGTGCNSGAVNDTNYDIRWTETKVGGPTYSITGGALAVDIPDPNSGFPVSDNFNGEGTNTGAVGGFGPMPNDRWTQITNTAPISYTGGVYRVSVEAVFNTDVALFEAQSINHSGDFSVEYDLEISDIVPAAADPAGPGFWLGVVLGSDAIGIGWHTSLDGWMTFVNSSFVGYEINNTGGTKTLKIERVGSTVTFYSGGSSVRTYSSSSDLTKVYLYSSNAGGSGGAGQTRVAAVGTYDNLVVVDGSDNDILMGSGGAAITSSIKFANNIPAQSGDFYAEVTIDVDSVTGTGKGPAMELRIDADTAVGYYQNNTISGWGYQKSGFYNLVTTGLGSKSVAIGRTGSTVSIYIDGTVEDTVTLTGSKTPELFASNNLNSTDESDGISGSFDDFIIEDSQSLGDDIYIDPTGESC